MYRDALEGVQNIKIFQEPVSCKSNYWLQSLILDNNVAEIRNQFLEITNNNNLMTRPAWALIHSQQPYLNSPKATLEVSENLASRLINIPSSADLV